MRLFPPDAVTFKTVRTIDRGKMYSSIWTKAVKKLNSHTEILFHTQTVPVENENFHKDRARGERQCKQHEA